MDQLSYLMCDHYKCKIDLCGISETFFNQQHLYKETNICGYSTVRRDRKNKGGEGLVVYIIEKHEFIHKQYLECVNVESICPSNNKRFLVANVYRPPSCTNLDIVSSGRFQYESFREIS